jgi:transposase
VLEVLAGLPRCTVAMEACGGAHFWGREIGKLGHEVRLIPPAYVKPFVRRQKNDAADAEAICEAAQRPNMRFVPVKNEEKQGAAAVFRVRELLIRQRTQTIDALRGHLTEFGEVVPQGLGTRGAWASWSRRKTTRCRRGRGRRCRSSSMVCAISTRGSPGSTRRSPAERGKTRWRDE